MLNKILLHLEDGAIVVCEKEVNKNSINLLKLYKTDEMVNGCVIMLQNKCNTLNVQIEDLLTPVSETTPWLTFTTSNL